MDSSLWVFFGMLTGFFLFSFSKPSDLPPSQGYLIEGRMTDPRKGAKSHEAQIEDQCFKAAADGRDRDL